MATFVGCAVPVRTALRTTVACITRATPSAAAVVFQLLGDAKSVFVSVPVSVSVFVSMATSCVTQEHLRENPDVLELFFWLLRMYLWWTLCNWYLHAWKATYRTRLGSFVVVLVRRLSSVKKLSCVLNFQKFKFIVLRWNRTETCVDGRS